MGSTGTRACRMEAWIFASSPSPSRAPATTPCSPSPRPPRTSASTPSSAPTTICAWASGDGLPGPTDAWITLAGLARETKRIRLGTLMTAGTFRLPGVLAIQVAQVDQMSGGRVELGLGAGWFEEEHKAYGIPFPKEKFGRLEEQLAIVTGLWADRDRRDLRLPRHVLRPHRLARAAQARPGPKIPVLIGGHGATRTPRLAARYADEFNMPFASVEDSERQFGRVRAAAEEAGPAARRPHLLQRPRRLRRQGRPGGRPPRRRDRPRGRRAEGQRPGRHPRRGRRQDRPLRRRSAPAASTSRSSTSPTWTTWS